MKHMVFGVLIGFLTLGAFDSGVEAKSSSGVASFYKSGKQTANGESFNPNGLTAAHRTLPFGTKVRVTSTRTGNPCCARSMTAGLYP
jgi:rare lipoprotein A